jgi:hypothetical protein
MFGKTYLGKPASAQSACSLASMSHSYRSPSPEGRQQQPSPACTYTGRQAFTRGLCGTLPMRPEYGRQPNRLSRTGPYPPRKPKRF